MFEVIFKKTAEAANFESLYNTGYVEPLTESN